jgi:hypothetical protein
MNKRLFTLENGIQRKTNDMEEGYRFGQMDQDMKDIGRMIRLISEEA